MTPKDDLLSQLSERLGEIDKQPRARGTGGLFLRGKVYYGKWYDREGKVHVVSLHTSDAERADRDLRRLIQKSDRGEYTKKSVRRTTVKELWEGLIAFYTLKKRRSLKMVTAKWPRISKHFNCRASDVTTDMLTKYIIQCQNLGLTNATINRDIAALKKAFNLGFRCTPKKVTSIPVFPDKLPEAMPRQGFVTQQQFDLLCKHADSLWMRALITTAYAFGFRRGELLNMKVKQLDFANRTLELYRGTTKSGEPRLVPMTPDVYELLRAMCQGKDADDLVFTRDPEAYRPIVDTRDAWANMCVKAGLGKFICPRCQSELNAEWKCSRCSKQHDKHSVLYTGLIFHDLRRSAVRNMVRRGINEKLAMEISGHKTREVFSRYNIVDMTDLRRAAKQIEAGQKYEQENGSETFGVQHGIHFPLGRA